MAEDKEFHWFSSYQVSRVGILLNSLGWILAGNDYKKGFGSQRPGKEKKKKQGRVCSSVQGVNVLPLTHLI